MQVKIPKCLLALAGALLIAPQLWATTMIQMDLADLTDRADRIFRGTVVDVEQGSIEVGGGALPAVTYKLRVEDLLKGQADLVKGDSALIEIRMVGSIKGARRVGDAQHFSPLYDVPRLEMGSDYVLFVTPKSAVGLSTTVGLGQGAFSVFSLNREDVAVNAFNNAGLGLGTGGPVGYSELAAKVSALLGQ